MKPILIYVLALFLSIGIVGCESDSQKRDNQDVCKITNVSYTDCKKNITKGNVDDCKECLEIQAEGKHLKIKHINVMFNCCPGKLLVESQTNADTISINEDEKESGCKCICPYDLKYKVGTLEYGIYHIVLKKKNEIVCEFDLKFKYDTHRIIELKNGKCK